MLHYNYQSDFKNSCDRLSKDYNFLGTYLIFALSSENFKTVTDSQLITLLEDNTIIFHRLHNRYSKPEFPDNGSMMKKYEVLLKTLTIAYESNEDSLMAEGNYVIYKVGHGGPMFRVDGTH